MRRFAAFFVFTGLIFAATAGAAASPANQQNVEPKSRHALPYAPNHKKRIVPYAERQLIAALSQVFNRDTIQKIFSDPRLQLDKSVVARAAAEYAPSTLLTPESIARGEDFITRNEMLLAEAEQKWQVEREVIAAIIRTETNFGKHLGSRSVLNTLYSIYILNPKKREFAFKELVAFLELAKRYSWEPFEIKGSVVGAIGLPQFLPTSYNLFAVDARGDGQADLFDEADAIASVANYLALHGWGERFAQKRKAVFAYNHSSAYVDDIFSYARALKRQMPPEGN